MKKKPQTLLVERRHPFRLWMTGSVAVAMAAIMPIRDASQTERQQLMRLLRHTHLGVNETIQRLEASARDHGLSVLAMVRGERSVMVLGSSVGGTPVVMEEADSVPSMPLSLMVREGMSGGADDVLNELLDHRQAFRLLRVEKAADHGTANFPIQQVGEALAFVAMHQNFGTADRVRHVLLAQNVLGDAGVWERDKGV